jgi:uncharacterized membrane protein
MFLKKDKHILFLLFNALLKYIFILEKKKLNLGHLHFKIKTLKLIFILMYFIYFILNEIKAPNVFLL